MQETKLNIMKGSNGASRRPPCREGRTTRKEHPVKDGFIKVAALTPKIRVADTVYNAKQTEIKIREAAERGARLMVFPELGLTGYTCEDLFGQETLLEGAREALRVVKGCSRGLDALIFVGLPLEKDGKLYNTAAAVQDGRILAFIPKTTIPNYGEFYEARHFAPGYGGPDSVRFDREEIPALEAACLFGILALCVISLSSSAYNPFIYFRF